MKFQQLLDQGRVKIKSHSSLDNLNRGGFLNVDFTVDTKLHTFKVKYDVDGTFTPLSQDAKCNQVASLFLGALQ